MMLLMRIIALKDGGIIAEYTTQQELEKRQSLRKPKLFTSVRRRHYWFLIGCWHLLCGVFFRRQIILKTFYLIIWYEIQTRAHSGIMNWLLSTAHDESNILCLDEKSHHTCKHDLNVVMSLWSIQCRCKHYSTSCASLVFCPDILSRHALLSTS